MLMPTSAPCLIVHQPRWLRPGCIPFSTREASESASPERGHLLGSSPQLALREAPATPAACCLHLGLAWKPAAREESHSPRTVGCLDPKCLFRVCSWNDFPEELGKSGPTGPAHSKAELFSFDPHADSWTHFAEEYTWVIQLPIQHACFLLPFSF